MNLKSHAKKKLRVAILHPKIIQGGAEKIIVFFASYLASKGHSVDVFTLYVRPEELNARHSSGINYIRPGGLAGKLCAIPLFRKLIGLPVMYSMFASRVKNYDAVHANNFPSHWVAAMLAPKRTVWQCNEPPMKVDPAHIKSIGLFEYLLSFIYNNPADKKLVARIPEISVLDGMNRDRVRKQYGRDSRVIYIGIEEDYFRTAGSSRAVILKKHGLSVGDAHLICAGNFVPGKNQKLLVRMMGILKSRGIKRVKLILVGRGPDREMLGEMAKSAGVDASVYFAGFLTNENLRELYSASDINLFPAVNQSWGLTPFEAAAQGIPSVVSKDCGTAEVIKKYGIGVLAEPEAGDFAEAVTGLLRFPARIKKLGMKARAFVRRNMHWKNYGEEMIKIFKKINGPGDKNG